MSGCIYKRGDGRCDKPGRYLSPCIGEACQHQTPSNADRIRAMSDDELADEILDWLVAMYSVEWTPKNILSWLKSPADKGDDG